LLSHGESSCCHTVSLVVVTRWV